MTKKRSTTPKALRELAPGVSLRQLAKRTGLRLEHLSRIVNGRRGLTLENAARIALALDCTIEQVHQALAPDTVPDEQTLIATPMASTAVH